MPTYRSSWLKTHYRAQFFAGILTHDPGMYPRRVLLDDARRAGVPILPLDIHRSEPEYVAEETGEGTANGAIGIRIGLQDVHGISAADIRSILEARAAHAFHDVGDVLRRTTVPRPVVEALAHAGAFDALPGGRRGHLYEAITVEAPREGDQLDARRRVGVPPRVPGLQRRRGGPRRARRVRDGRDPAPRELLRTVAARPRRHPCVPTSGASDRGRG